MTAQELLVSFVLVIGAYLLGSVPLGFLVCRIGFGINILDYGSRRSGATNVLRTAGPGAAAIVLAGDILKGFVPALVASLVVGHLELVPILAAFAAIAGHNWSIFLKFRGGRGVATTLGCVMALAPISAAFGLPIGLGIIAIGRYTSLGSLIGSFLFVIGAIVFYALDLGVTGFHLALICAAVLVVFLQHIGNLQRLFAGTERRLAPWPELMGGRGPRGRGSGR